MRAVVRTILFHALHRAHCVGSRRWRLYGFRHCVVLLAQFRRVEDHEHRQRKKSLADIDSTEELAHSGLPRAHSQVGKARSIR